MKIDPSETPNGLRDVEGDDAEALEELVRGIRGRGPTPDAVQRITKRLAAVGALAPSSFSDKPPVASPATARIAGNVGYYKAGALALAALAAGSLLAWRATYTSSDTPAQVVTAAPAATVLSSPPSSRMGGGEPGGPRAANEASEEPAATEAPRIGTSVPAVSIDSLPSAAPIARAPAPADTNVRATTENSGAKSATPEHLLVRRAQDALASDPGRALALANEHASHYPSGELTQEREVVAVDALAKLGRKDDALLRARGLVRRFPRTPYVAHLEKAVGQPLTASGADDAAKPNSKSHSTP